MQLRDYPKSAKEAKATKSKYYFTGRPCIRGHVDLRYSHGSCIACKAEDRDANREANAAYARQWRKENPEIVKAQHDRARARGDGKTYYLKNRQKQIAKAIAWAKENPEKASKANKDYRARYPEKFLEYRSRYYQENKREILDAGRRYRQSCREERAAATRQWRKNNPEKAKAADRNKKAIRKGSIGRHTANDIQRILKMQRHKCAWCKTCIRSEYHVDHITPIALGGSNWPRNLQCLCPPCNLTKHARNPLEFARDEGRLL